MFLSCLFFCYRCDSKIFRSNQFGCCTRNKPHLYDPSAIVAIAFQSILTLSSFRNYLVYNTILLYETCYPYDSKFFNQINTVSSCEIIQSCLSFCYRCDSKQIFMIFGSIINANNHVIVSMANSSRESSCCNLIMSCQFEIICYRCDSKWFQFNQSNSCFRIVICLVVICLVVLLLSLR